MDRVGWIFFFFFFISFLGKEKVFILGRAKQNDKRSELELVFSLCRRKRVSDPRTFTNGRV